VGTPASQNPQMHALLDDFVRRRVMRVKRAPAFRVSIISAIRLHPQTGPDFSVPFAVKLILDRFHHAERVPALPMRQTPPFFPADATRQAIRMVFQLHAQS